MKILIECIIFFVLIMFCMNVTFWLLSAADNFLVVCGVGALCAVLWLCKAFIDTLLKEKKA